MEVIKHHNKLWRTEVMFLHDYLEVPVSREVFEAFQSSNESDDITPPELPLSNTHKTTVRSNSTNVPPNNVVSSGIT